MARTRKAPRISANSVSLGTIKQRGANCFITKSRRRKSKNKSRSKRYQVWQKCTNKYMNSKGKQKTWCGNKKVYC